MELEIRVTNTTKDTLNRYDIDDLLSTLSSDFSNRNLIRVLKAYTEKKPKLSTINITISQKNYNWIEAIAENHNINFEVMFNFLIENIVDCGKIHTKRIKQALDCYYYAAAHDKSLFSQILSEYALSKFYNDEIGLSEEGIAYFLATTKNGQNLIKSINRGLNTLGLFFSYYHRSISVNFTPLRSPSLSPIS